MLHLPEVGGLRVLSWFVAAGAAMSGETRRGIDNPPQWDVPGWDWEPDDFSWLSSRSGIHKDGASIFFIHGGRIRHQAHIPDGSYPIEEFVALVTARAEGLDNPRVEWCEDTGGGSAALWVEGTRPPNDEDRARLQAARDRQRRDDEYAARELKKRRPELFEEGGAA